MKQTLYALMIILMAFQACGTKETTATESLKAIQETDTATKAEVVTNSPAPKADARNLKKFDYNIIFNQAQGYGYEIIKEQKPLIRQLTIPGLPGNQGFTTEEFAEKAAQLVVYKLENNQMPPSISTAELDSLGIPYTQSIPNN